VVIGPAILAAVWKMVFEPIDPMNLDEVSEAHLDVILYGLLSRAG
jgi:hypothetical protein